MLSCCKCSRLISNENGSFLTDLKASALQESYVVLKSDIKSHLTTTSTSKMPMIHEYFEKSSTPEKFKEENQIGNGYMHSDMTYEINKNISQTIGKAWKQSIFR